MYLINQLNIISQITMKRRSILYIVNFILPVLFFLCLDLASFLISDTGGEKLSFKVTILLAVTVMQLILNDILPCSSNKVPLIGKEMYLTAHSYSSCTFMSQLIIKTYISEDSKQKIIWPGPVVKLS